MLVFIVNLHCNFQYVTFCVNAKTFSLSFTGILEIVFTIAAPAFDILFIGCVSNAKIVYKTAEKLMLKPFIDFKCCKMLLEDGEARR